MSEKLSGQSLQQYSQLSRNLTKSLDNKIKKEQGIYFTPLNIIEKSVNSILGYITKHKINIKNILEPSCGSCEYIQYIDNIWKDVNIDGIEYNQTIYKNITDLTFKNKINLFNEDYLKFTNNDKKYDLIIGNPPFFVMKKKNVKKEYSKYYDGRPNIFILFIIHSLSKLNKDGILSFILPINFMNCLYYNKLREHINRNYKILNILDCSTESYIETAQDTIIFIVQNNKTRINNNNYTLRVNGYTIFNITDNIKKLQELYKNSTVLDKINFRVKVGNVVWNQVKDLLTDDTKQTRLIYSSDIVNNKLVIKKYKNIRKKNFIFKKGKKNPLLVVNRGYGKGLYKFNYCLINMDKEYLIENHLICIEYKNKINDDNLIKLYEKIIKSFNSIETQKFISLYFGNNAINTTELQYILPIYLE